MGNEGPKITISAYRPLTSMVSGNTATPGPGQYDFSLIDRPKSPSYRIGSSKRNAPNRQGDFPGPGTYEGLNLTTSNRPKSPTWSMGKSMRPNLSSSNFLPGPGNYETYAKVGEGPKVNSNFFDKKNYLI